MIWTAGSETLLNNLQVLQKMIFELLADTDPLFNKFQLLKLKQIRHF